MADVNIMEMASGTIIKNRRVGLEYVLGDYVNDVAREITQRGVGGCFAVDYIDKNAQADYDVVQTNGVLIAIQPHWCELIAEGKKLVEVRKTFPSAYAKPFPAAPSDFDKFKCFIYCTQKGKSSLAQGKVISEFTCSGIETYGYNQNGYGLKDEKKLLELSCLTAAELYHYLQGKKAYGWGISDLVMYDEPHELNEFGVTIRASGKQTTQRLSRPPQSWCYTTFQCDSESGELIRQPFKGNEVVTYG